jgi:hypothetical protein
LVHERPSTDWQISVQPSGHVRITEFSNPGVIPTKVIVVQLRAPLSARTAVKKLRVVVPKAVTSVGHEVVSPSTHLIELGARHELWPPFLEHMNTETPGQGTHLPFEVDLKIVVVEEDQVGAPVVAGQKVTNMVEKSRQAAPRFFGRLV